MMTSFVSAEHHSSWQSILGISAEYNPWNVFKPIPAKDNPFKSDNRPFPWWLLAGCILFGLYIAYGDKGRHRRRKKVARKKAI